MATKPNAATVKWEPGEIGKVTECIGVAQACLDHFKRLFGPDSPHIDYFEPEELEMMAALINVHAGYVDGREAASLNLIALKLFDPNGGGGGVGKDVPDNPH